MSTVVKDLGAATAYGYAVEKGYTGTEAEFAELMASYATVGQTAVTAAQTATTKASEAATSATTATNKASEATTAATTATNKAAEAQADADAAALDASQAMSAASTATTKATEATTAAATATSAKTDAVAANTAAQSAKTAAQTAQTGAETAAASVQSSAAQIATNTSDISELKEDLDYITDRSKNLFPIEEVHSTAWGIAVEYKDGVVTFNGTRQAITPNYDYSACTPIELPEGTYTLSRTQASNQTILRKLNHEATTNVVVLQGTTNSAQFTLSEQTTLYLYFGLHLDSYDNEKSYIQIESGGTATAWEAPSLTVKGMPQIIADIAEIGLPYVTPELTWTAGKAFVYNAGWKNNSGWSYADVDLIQGQSLDITMYCTTIVYPLSVWSADGTSILKACFALASEEGEKHFVYACAAQHEKVRINVMTSYKSAVVAKIYQPDNQVNISNIEAINHDEECFDVLHNNIIAIGDSLTQGSYTGHDLHTEQSYPSFLAKKIGCEVENAGRAGWSAQQWWEGDSTTQKGFPYYNFADYDTCVICLGTNGGLTDTLETDVDPYSVYTDYANTNTGCYCKIIEGILAQNANINILLCNIWSTNGAGGRTVTNAVIDKIAQKYNLPVINLLSEFISEFTIYHAVHGNIHLGRIGYARMADIIRQAINNNVLDRPTNYNYIPS